MSNMSMPPAAMAASLLATVAVVADTASRMAGGLEEVAKIGGVDTAAGGQAEAAKEGGKDKKSFADKITEPLEKLGKDLEAKLKGFPDEVKATFENAGKDLLDGAWTSLKEKIDAFVEGIFSKEKDKKPVEEQADAKPAEDQAKETLKPALDGLVEPFKKFGEDLEVELKTIPDKFKGLLENTGKGLLGAVLDPLKEAGDSLISGMFSKDKKKKEGEEEKEDKKSLGDKIGENLKSVFDGFSKNFEGLFEGFGDTFTSLFSGLTEGLSEGFGGLLSGLGGLLGGEGGGIGSLLGAVGSLFGFAGGGRVQPGVPAVVGERGPELIVPSRPSTVMNAADSRGASGAKSVSVNQTVNFDLVPSPTINAMIDAKKGEIERSAIEGTLKALNRGVI